MDGSTLTFRNGDKNNEVRGCVVLHFTDYKSCRRESLLLIKFPKLNRLPLTLISTFITMSRPSAGNYIIYSRVLSPTGDKLAFKAHDIDEFVTVEPSPSYDDTFEIIVRNTVPLLSLHLLCYHSY